MSIANKIRVLIGDDDPIIIAGIQKSLLDNPQIRIVGKITDPAQTSQLIDELLPDVLVIDLAWWGDKMAGIEQIHYVRTHYPEIKIIAITAYEELIEKAKLAGAHRAREKGFEVQDFVEMIIAVHQSKVNPQSIPRLIDPLSDREIKVLKLMATGMTDRKIGIELGFAETTIKADLRNIYSKLNAKNRAEAVSLGHKLGILS